MSKLYPPNIEGTLPAFYDKVLVVPYTMNKAVSYNEFTALQIKISTVYNSALVASLQSENFDENQVYFNLDKVELNEGQSYKVQLAYFSTDEIIGYYSTVGIVKFTTKPEVNIEGLRLNDSNGLININSSIFKAVYSNTDTTEKPYLYKFDLYDRDKNLLETSGEIFNDSYELTYQLQDYYQYYIKLIITTANGIIAESGYYRIMESLPIAVEEQGVLTAENDVDRGSVKLAFTGDKGYFKILRAEAIIAKQEDEDYRESTPTERITETITISSSNQWQDIHHFTAVSDEEIYAWEDTTVEPGKTYYYCVQQYGLSRAGKRSTPICIKAVKMNYDCLSDAEKLFVVKYNPKMNSFKNTLLESKTDTLGGKYPFIFRNGEVKYKEFSFSGTIALAENGNLTQENFNNERELKLEVLDWLNNGKPKLFRSLAEGCYIIRLLNVSLTSEAKIGRLVATFSATAYEVADCDYANLKKNGIISLDTTFQEVEENVIYTPAVSDVGISNILQSAECRDVKLVDFPSGTIIKVNDSEEFKIDSSGELGLTGVVSSLQLVSYSGTSGLIVYTYDKKLSNDNLDASIDNRAIQDVPFMQVNEEFTVDNKAIYYYKIIDSATGKQVGYYNYNAGEYSGEELDFTRLDERIIYLSYYEEVDAE